MTDTDTSSWGIEPVPERLRVLGVLDGFLLWANLSVSLLVIVAGAFLVLPADEFGLAMSLPDALGECAARTQEAPISGISGRPRTRPRAARRSRATHSSF